MEWGGALAGALPVSIEAVLNVNEGEMAPESSGSEHCPDTLAVHTDAGDQRRQTP